MNSRYLTLAALLGLMVASQAHAAYDTVYELSGTKHNGKVTSMTPDEVTVTRGGLSSTVAVNLISYISFDTEPLTLRTARKHVRDGRFEDAVALIEKIKAKVDAGTRGEVVQDIAYYEALARGQMAIGGSADHSLGGAAKMMLNFVKENPDNFHYYQACQTLGQLATALGSYPTAIKYYKRVGNAPWKDYKMRAMVGIGQANLAQKSYAEALTWFERAIKRAGTDAESQRARRSCVLGKARALAATGKIDASIQLVNTVLGAAGVDERVLLAQAYTTLGDCYRKSNKPKEAVLEFLKVDLLYNTHPDSHAEALSNLVELWTQLNQRDRSVKARKMLQSYYPKSRFAAK